MRRYEHFSAVIVGLSCWLLLPPHCRSQERPLDARLFEVFYNKMVEVLALGSPSGSSQLILANPGLLLEPWSDGDSPSDRYELFKLSDEALEPSGLARPVGRRISEIYAYLLENAEPDVPEPTPAEKARTAKARALLYNGGDSDKGESPAYQRYKDYKRKVEEQEGVLAKARQGGTATSEQTAKRSTLLTEWRTVGRKSEIESALAVANRRDATSWWSDLRKRYTKHLIASADSIPSYPRTIYEPEFSSWTADEGWTILSLDDEAHRAGASPKISWPTNWGMWSFGEGDAQATKTSKASTYRVRVDIKRVSIVRPWLDPMLFTARWRWKERQAGFSPSRADQETGVNSCLPTALVLGRNLRLTSSWPEEERIFARTRLRKKGSLGWGPLTLGGKALPSSSGTYFRAVPLRTGFSLEVPQVLGWICEPLRQSRQTQ